MGTIADTFASVYRDYETDGVPASGDHDPEKSEIRALGALVEAVISAAGAALLRYATKAALDADTAQTDGQLAYVYADGTAANNTVYQWNDGANAWQVAAWYFNAVAAVVSPLVELARQYANASTNADIPGATPGDRGAKYWASVAANAATIFGTPFPAGFDQSGYRYVLFGDDGNLLFGVTDDATPQFVSGSFVSTSLADTLVQMLGGTTVSYSGGAGFTQSGRGWFFAGSDGTDLGGVSDDPFPVPTGPLSPFASARDAFVSGLLFDLVTRRDAEGRSQVYSIDRSTSALRQLSSPGHDAINPTFDRTGLKAVWQTSNVDRWPSNRLRSRRADASFPTAHAFPVKLLGASGDSTDAGSVATAGNSYMSRLAAGLGLTLTNKAIGGQQAWQQAMQMGVLPTFLTLASASVGTSATAVSAIGTVNPRTGATVTQNVAAGTLYPNTLLLSTGADNTGRSLAGWVVDATGARQRATLNRSASGGPPATSETYTVTSLAGVAIVTASNVVQFIPDTGDFLSYVLSIGGGLNDLGQGSFAPGGAVPAATILADVGAIQDAFVNALGPAVPAFIIQGMYNQASAFTQAGTAVNTAINDFIAERKAKYGRRYVDRKAIFLAGGNGSAQDNADIANEWIPASLRGVGDIIHPNDTGHGLVYTGNAGATGALALLQPQVAMIPTA